jgi:UDP-MurNAc hydroxylase
MHITYLGHAGFLVETDQIILVTDPWLSPEGAFDSAWFQLPCNHHLAPFLQQKLRNTEKRRFLYVSHEHRDHFDPEFIKTLPTSEMTFLVPRFQRAALRTELATLNPASLVLCEHAQSVPVPGGYVKLYLDDSGLNRDSALLVNASGQTFLNMNDCKLYDEVAAIREQEGPISVLSCQYSGATWHPTCYEYDSAEYERISRQKLLSKFEMVARAIDAVRPNVYLPSAGPACFLDPDLLHLNFESVNIFPRATQFLDFLRIRLADSPTRLFDIMPGDLVCTATAQHQPLAEERVDETNYSQYIHDYAARYADYFADRQPRLDAQQFDTLLDSLSSELQTKLALFTLRDRIRVPLYFGFRDSSTNDLLRLDFAANKIERVPSIRESDYYSLKAPSWQIARILNHAITWEEFALTFRMRLNRKPDVYQTLIQGFLLMEPEDMNWFCGRLLDIEQRQKRIIVEANGMRYSIDRFCPHQGADLSQGWLAENGLWTCPRHRWQFALDKEGRCLTSNGSIHAVCLEND